MPKPRQTPEPTSFNGASAAARIIRARQELNRALIEHRTAVKIFDQTSPMDNNAAEVTATLEDCVLRVIDARERLSLLARSL